MSYKKNPSAAHTSTNPVKTVRRSLIPGERFSSSRGVSGIALLHASARAARNRSMNPVSNSPARNPASWKIAWCSEIEVSIPCTTN
jgi:hypothetical protein